MPAVSPQRLSSRKRARFLQKSCGHDADAVASWAKALPQPAWCVYKSGPTGFDLKRKLDESGVE